MDIGSERHCGSIVDKLCPERDVLLVVNTDAQQGLYVMAWNQNMQLA